MSTAIIEFAGEVLFLSPDERRDLVSVNLLGGHIQYSEKKTLLKSLYDFMRQEIKNKYNKDYDIPEKAFVDQLIPPYTKYLIDLINRICSDTDSGKNICRIFDLINYESVLHGLKPTTELLGIYGENCMMRSIDLTADLVTFSVRSNLIDSRSKDKFEMGLNQLRSQLK